MEHRVRFHMLEMLAEGRSALIGRDIALEGDTSRDRLDWGKVDADDQGIGGHNLRSISPAS